MDIYRCKLKNLLLKARFEKSSYTYANDLYAERKKNNLDSLFSGTEQWKLLLNIQLHKMHDIEKGR